MLASVSLLTLQLTAACNPRYSQIDWPTLTLELECADARLECRGLDTAFTKPGPHALEPKGIGHQDLIREVPVYFGTPPRWVLLQECTPPSHV